MHGTCAGWGWVRASVWLCVWACLWGSALSARLDPGFSAAAGVQPQQQISRPVCRGLHKVDVDWWVMLKHPRGYQYSYIDSNSVSSSVAGSCDKGVCWQHALSMQNPNPVSHTLEVLATAADTAAAAARSDLAYVIYNDADPEGTEHFLFAHAKGVVAFSHSSTSVSASSNLSSSASGFWLVHSAPRFPHVPGEPDWTQLQRPQTVFGQHFSCFSLASNSSIAAVAEVLLAAGPYVYSSQLPVSLAVQYPGWQLLLAGAFDRTPRAVNADLVSSAGQQLLVFAKPGVLNVSLTDQVVGPGLGVDMFWETWRRSHDALASVCPAAEQQASAQHSSLNIGQVAFQGTRYRWGWDQDHSKWGVSSSASTQPLSTLFVCLGDMNRAAWQAHRGGSYVCLQHTGLWEAFHSILAAAEPCMWHA